MSNIAHPLRRPTLTRLNALLAAPAARLLGAAQRTARERDTPTWVVGGAVRDCAAGLTVRDVDLGIEAPDGDAVADFALEIAERVNGTVLRPAPRLGTALVQTAEAHLDLAPLRAERYPRPGVLPSVRFGVDIEADLARRDYTVNAMALGLAGSRAGDLVDPLGGLADLAGRRLRVLHERSFRDDATRLWRGARAAAQHRLRPDPLTSELIEGGTHWLDSVAGERIYAEFELTAVRRYAFGAFTLLDAWSVLRGTHPAWRLPERSRSALRHRPGPYGPAVLAGVLFAPLEGGDAVLDRLRAPRRIRDAVSGTRRLLEAASAARASAEPDRLASLEGIGPEARTAALWLDPSRQRPLQHQLRRWERTRSPLNGEGLRSLGVPPGPRIGEALRCLRRRRYLGTLKGGADARRAVREWLADGWGR